MFPVDAPTLGAFALVALGIVMSPGPDTVLILRHSMTSGRAAGLATVAGIQTGLAVHTVLAALGVSLIIASSPPLLRMVALAGAGYLAWLGIQGWRGGTLRFDGSEAAVGTAKAWRDAVMCNILNPKIIVLFLALFPNFIDTGQGAVTAQLTTLAILLIVINTVWQVPMVWAADAIRSRLANPSVQRAVSRLSGAILLVMAAALLFENLIAGR